MSVSTVFASCRPLGDVLSWAITEADLIEARADARIV